MLASQSHAAAAAAVSFESRRAASRSSVRSPSGKRDAAPSALANDESLSERKRARLAVLSPSKHQGNGGEGVAAARLQTTSGASAHAGASVAPSTSAPAEPRSRLLSHPGERRLAFFQSLVDAESKRPGVSGSDTKITLAPYVEAAFTEELGMHMRVPYMESHEEVEELAVQAAEERRGALPDADAPYALASVSTDSAMKEQTAGGEQASRGGTPQDADQPEEELAEGTASPVVAQVPPELILSDADLPTNLFQLRACPEAACLVLRPGCPEAAGGAEISAQKERCGWTGAQDIWLYLCLVRQMPRAAASAAAPPRSHAVPSHYHAYIHYLPNPEDFSSPTACGGGPLFWTEEELDKYLLPTSDLRHELRRIRGTLRRQVEDMKLTERFGITLSDWFWARTVYTSRAFPKRLKPGATVPLMLPLDVFNYRMHYPATVCRQVWDAEQRECDGQNEFKNATTACVLLILSEDPELASGEEVFNDYGNKGNEDLLGCYGFCIPDNPYDQVFLQISSREPTEGEWRRKYERLGGVLSASSPLSPSSSLYLSKKGSKAPTSSTGMITLVGSEAGSGPPAKHTAETHRLLSTNFVNSHALDGDCWAFPLLSFGPFPATDLTRHQRFEEGLRNVGIVALASPGGGGDCNSFEVRVSTMAAKSADAAAHSATAAGVDGLAAGVSPERREEASAQPALHTQHFVISTQMDALAEGKIEGGDEEGTRTRTLAQQVDARLKAYFDTSLAVVLTKMSRASKAEASGALGRKRSAELQPNNESRGDRGGDSDADFLGYAVRETDENVIIDRVEVWLSWLLLQCIMKQRRADRAGAQGDLESSEGGSINAAMRNVLQDGEQEREDGSIADAEKRPPPTGVEDAHAAMTCRREAQAVKKRHTEQVVAAAAVVADPAPGVAASLAIKPHGEVQQGQPHEQPHVAQLGSLVSEEYGTNAGHSCNARSVFEKPVYLGGVMPAQLLEIAGILSSSPNCPGESDDLEGFQLLGNVLRAKLEGLDGKEDEETDSAEPTQRNAKTSCALAAAQDLKRRQGHTYLDGQRRVLRRALDWLDRYIPRS